MKNQFNQLNVKKELLKAIEVLGFSQMTPIQTKCLPFILQGEDVIGQGKTGSGKTVCFGLGVLSNFDEKLMKVQSLILCPTRELSVQVAQTIRKLAQHIHNVKVLTITGGTPIAPQINSLEYGAHIIVGTPGRIMDHIDRKTINLSKLKVLVLDEADRMMDMGFKDDLDFIVNRTPSSKQTLLFSATFPEEIQAISSSIQRNPQYVKVEDQVENIDINQIFYYAENADHRFDIVKDLLYQIKPKSCLLFCERKFEAEELGNRLLDEGFFASSIHGDLEQRDRETVLTKFMNNSISILVATDVAARGIDIDNLELVINYEVSKNPEMHVHRIGRTGRAGNKGMAINLVHDKEKYKLERIEEYLQKKFEIQKYHISIKDEDKIAFQPSKKTLLINGGKRQKLRAGDILGALTAGGEISGDEVGKIDVLDQRSYVAVEFSKARIALNKITQEKVKGKLYKAKFI